MIGVIVCAAALLSAQDDKKTESFTIEAANVGISVKVTVEIGPFEKDKHNYSLKSLPKKGNLWVHIDGKRAWGSSGVQEIEYPWTEIRSITVDFGQGEIKLPSAAFSDLYNVYGLGSPEWPGWYLWVSGEKKVMRLKMIGADGTASYAMMLSVHTDGTCSRKTWDYGP